MLVKVKYLESFMEWVTEIESINTYIHIKAQEQGRHNSSY